MLQGEGLYLDVILHQPASSVGTDGDDRSAPIGHSSAARASPLPSRCEVTNRTAGYVRGCTKVQAGRMQCSSGLCLALRQLAAWLPSYPKPQVFEH